MPRQLCCGVRRRRLTLGIPERWERCKPLPDDIEESLKGLAPTLAKEGVILAFLFGSLAARDRSRPRTPGDMDLAVLTNGGPAWELREQQEEALGTRRPNLIDLRRASTVLLFEILRNSRPIYVRDELQRSEWELETLRVYRDTAPMRRRHMEYLERRMAERCSGQRS
jgi:predicted nucleotidyltransferase